MDSTANAICPPAQFVMTPIGVVQNARSTAEDDGWDLVNTRIVLDLANVGATATAGLADFSHVEVVFVFDRVDESDVHRGARHPRGNLAWPAVGILAQRGKDRPNRIGVTVCELMAVRPGGVLEVRGLDAIDGTPVLDIKPFMTEFGPRGEIRQPAWSHELMTEYWVRGADRVAAPDFDAWLGEIRRSPSDHGTLAMVVRRPAVGEREVLGSGELDLVVGLVGDNWSTRGSPARADGSSDPDAQLNLMNSRCAELVAGGTERMPLAGDQLFVDLDLTYQNVPPGTRLAIGEAVIEITPKPHTGCAHFTRRFGLATHRWINGPFGRSINLRGVCAKVVVPGTVRPGDVVRKLSV